MRLTPFFLILLFFFPFGKIKAQSFSLPAQQIAMANIKAVAFEPSSYGNPAASVFFSGLQAFASLENRLQNTDIQGFSLGGAYTSKLGSFQLGINRMGIEGLYLQEISLGFGRKLSEHTAIGGNILVLNRHADHYDDRQAISFNLGTQFALSENVQAGIFLSNPIPDRKELPTFNFNSEIAAGVIWKLTKLTTAFEIAKPQNTKYNIKTALDYRPQKALSILGGILVSEKQMTPSLGISYRLKGISITIGSAFYTQLATGLNFGVSYSDR